VPAVLLVESRRDDRVMYAEYLRARGFNPVEVDTTDEAVVQAGDCDVIVTGIRVDGPFDGLELVRRLRADARTARKPIIVLTAWALDPSRTLAYAAGCDVFLIKPCLPETLVRHIRRATRRRR
jgi:two-component system, cell cycle response regulator DivK